MKYLGIVVVIVAIAVQILGNHVPEEHSRIKRSLNSKLENFLQVKLRQMMKEGNPKVGLPVVDPFKKSEMVFDLDEKNMQVNANITDIHVDGIAGYKVDVSKVSIMSRKGTVGLTFPQINAKGKYSVKGVAMDDVDVYGGGEFNVTLQNLKVNAVVAVGLSGGVNIKSIQLTISLRALNFKATGIFDDENASILLSEIISDMGPQFISDYHKEITTTISKALIETANAMLHGKSISEIIAIIN